jgi:hypothetical protein
MVYDLNPGLHTENWRILDKQAEPKGQRHILYTDQAIKRTGYKIFTGLSQGTLMDLKDPEAQHQKEEGAVPNTASSESPTLSDDQRGAADAKEETPPSTKSTSADQETPLKETLSDKKEKAEDKGMKTDPSPSK